jgi:hypothetical protein
MRGTRTLEGLRIEVARGEIDRAIAHLTIMVAPAIRWVERLYFRGVVTNSQGQGVVEDNATSELVDLARRGDHALFVELASLLVPSEKVEECWVGARRRLGLEVRPGQ